MRKDSPRARELLKSLEGIETWLFRRLSDTSEWWGKGGDYVGLSNRGRARQFAIDAGIADVDYESLDSYNPILKVNYTLGDSIAAGFSHEDYAFVYYPLWFTRLADGVKVSAKYDDDYFLISGFWTDWSTSGVKGMPVIAHGSYSDEGIQDFTVIGIDVRLRGYPENTFRIIGNAIYNGLD